MRTYNIIVAGLGGQGVLFVSRALATAASTEYPYVCRTETRGLSQRGGSVSSELRISSTPVAPVIASAGADLLLSLDALEAVRYSNLVRSDGQILSHSKLIPPLHLVRQWSGESQDKLRDEFTSSINRILIHSVKAMLIDLNISCGDGRLNVALLGAVSCVLPLQPQALRTATLQLVKRADARVTGDCFDRAQADARKLYRSSAPATSVA
jgi:indolepyruvate ferredoxin oxidoreductase beta subunit